MVKSKGGRPSAVEISPYREEIEEMLREGKSPDFIESWLKTVNAPISRSAIYRYKKDKFNIQAEAVKKYNDEKSKERLDVASDDLVDDLKYLDNIINTANKVKLGHDNLYASEDGPNELDIEKHKLNIKKLGVQATKVRSDILKDDPGDPDINIFNLNGFDDDERQDIKKLAQSLAKSDTTE